MKCLATKSARIAAAAAFGALAFSAGGAGAKTLKEAAETAVATHPEVGQLRFSRLAIEQELRATRGGYLPQLDVRGAFGHEWTNNVASRTRISRGNGESGWIDMNRYEAGVSLRQLLFDGFGTDSEVSRQFYRVESSAHRTMDTAQVIALRAVEAYLEVQRTQRILDISMQNVRVHEEILRRVQARARGGRGPQSDVDQALGRLANAQANVATARRQYGDAVALYIQAVGEPPAALTDTTSPDSALPPSVEEAVTAATEQAPAIRAAMADVRVAHAAIGVADSRWFPVVTAEANYNFLYNADGTRGQAQQFSLMLQGRWNLYRGGSDVARKRESVARLYEARETLERSRREVAQQTRVSWNAVQSARERRGALQQQLTANERVRVAYSQQFDRGRRTLLDLLDIQNEIFNNQTGIATEEATIRFGIYRTLTSMGRLLETFGIAPPGEATRPPPRSVFHSVQDDLTPRRDDFIHTWRTPALGPRGGQPAPAAPTAAATEPSPPAPPAQPGQPAQPRQQ
jgi:adhesin transport system outer membrane protein